MRTIDKNELDDEQIDIPFDNAPTKDLDNPFSNESYCSNFRGD